MQRPPVAAAAGGRPRRRPAHPISAALPASDMMRPSRGGGRSPMVSPAGASAAGAASIGLAARCRVVKCECSMRNRAASRVRSAAGVGSVGSAADLHASCRRLPHLTHSTDPAHDVELAVKCVRRLHEIGMLGAGRPHHGALAARRCPGHCHCLPPQLRVPGPSTSNTQLGHVRCYISRRKGA